MYGFGMGNLDVYVIDQQTGAKSKILSKIGNKGKAWHRNNVTIVSYHDYKVNKKHLKAQSFIFQMRAKSVF